MTPSTLAELAARTGGPEPLIWVPLEEDGNDTGAPEVNYPPPAAPRLN